MKSTARILLISDFHYMAVPVGFQKGQIIGGISRVLEGVISIFKRFNNRNFYRALERIKSIGDFDLTVVLGDMLECDYNERGLTGYLDLEAVRKINKVLRETIKSEFRFIPGDHELGYVLPLSADPGGGVSLTSVENYYMHIGPLFSQMRLGDFRLIFLSSSLFIQSWEEQAEFERDLLEYFKNEQTLFLSKVLGEMTEREQAILFIHDPDALEMIHDSFSKELRFKIAKVFCGHMHAEETRKKYLGLGLMANSWKGKLLSIFSGRGERIVNWAKGNLRRHCIFEMCGLAVVPAFGGMMGQGGGFLVLNIGEDGTISIEKYKT